LRKAEPVAPYRYPPLNYIRFNAETCIAIKAGVEMKMYIGGRWVEGSSGSTISKYSPVNGNLLYSFNGASKDDVKAAISAAEAAFDGWSRKTSVERSKLLYRAKELIERDRLELEGLLARENGKIPMEAKEEVDGTIDQIQYYAEFARKITGDIVEGESPSRKILQYLVPRGVVAAITPWNFPAAMVARKLAPALLTGNTVVLKPSSDTPGSAEWIVRKFERAGVPRGVLNMVAGKGSEIGDALVSDGRISLVTMTGSTSTGQRIMEKASSNMAKLVLELGGKAPFMVWKDADLGNAMRTLLWAKYWNAGQSCIAAERLYVHEDIYDSFVKRFAAITKKLRLGNSGNADMGPLINSGALSNLKESVKEAIDGGGRLLAGGERLNVPKAYSSGYYMRPAVIAGAGQKSRLFQEEVFGPAIGALSVSSEEELFKKANDSRYGLASYLFTKDLALAQEASERIRFGELYINMPGPEASQGYHTGFRMTGQAGEGSAHGIREYLKLKNVYLGYDRGKISIPTVRKGLA
jgi:D-glyceraldehyde dehydrogenase (NADP+)